MSDVLIDETIKLIFLVLGTVLTAAAAALLPRLYQWLGLKKEEAAVAAKQTLELAERLKLRNIAVGVEEWAAARVKEALKNGKSISAPVISPAVKQQEFFRRALDAGFSDQKIVEWGPQEVAKAGLGAAVSLMKSSTVTVGEVSVTESPLLPLR